MKKIKSWRWSRLNDPDALKRAFSIETLLYIVVLIIMNIIPIYSFIISVPISILCLYNILGAVCLADEYVELINLTETGTHKIKIYIYLQNFVTQKALMLIKYKDYKDVFYIDHYNTIFASKHGWFMFKYASSVDKKSLWYTIKDNNYHLLGTRIGNAIFLDNETNHSLPCIKFLNGCHEIKCYPIEKFYTERSMLHSASNSNIYSLKTTDFILLKTAENYTLLSVTYLDDEDRMIPITKEEQITPLIIKDKDKKEIFVLAFDEVSKKYQEIYRGKNHLGLCDTIIDISSKTFPCNASVFKVDKKSNSLKNIYHGKIDKINHQKKYILCSTGKYIFF